MFLSVNFPCFSVVCDATAQKIYGCVSDFMNKVFEVLAVVIKGNQAVKTRNSFIATCLIFWLVCPRIIEFILLIMFVAVLSGTPRVNGLFGEKVSSRAWTVPD